MGGAGVRRRRRLDTGLPQALGLGEALVAQGVLQICELVWQLRGQAGSRQVPDAKVGLSAVLGLGANGASVVLTA